MGAVSYSDFEELIIALSNVLNYEFYVGSDSFSLMDVLFGLFGCGVIVLAIRRLFTFYVNPRR